MNNELNNQLFHIELIKKLLESKKAKVASYSLRALARDLNVTQPLLTKIIQGQRRLSPSIAYRVAVKLNFTKDELHSLLISTLD